PPTVATASIPAAAVRQPTTPHPSSPPPREARSPQGKGSIFIVLVATALVGLAVAAILHSSHTEQAPGYVPPEPVAPAPTPARSAEVPTTPAAPSSSADDLPAGAEVAPGFGLVQVRTAPRAVVRIDGAVAGSGPFVASVAKPGYDEVRMEQGGRTSTHVIQVRAGKATQVQSAPPQ